MSKLSRIEQLESKRNAKRPPMIPPPAYVEGWGTPSARIVGYARPQAPGSPIDYRRAFDDDAVNWLEEPIPCRTSIPD